MKRNGRVWLGFLLLASATRLADAASDKIVDEGLVVTNITVISPERDSPVPHTAVAIRDGRITEIGTNLVAGPRAQHIDGDGRFLIPGLIDSHVHVGHMGPLDDDAIATHPELLQAYRSQLPRSYLAFGFTTLVDLDLREETLAWFNAAPNHPDLCSCGRGVRIVGGYMAQRPPKDAAAANAANIVYEPTEAKTWPANLDPKNYSPARAVARAVGARAICLKTFVEPGFGGAANWPVPSAETLATLRAEASKEGLVFIVHANAIESWKAAIGARSDVIAHGLWQWPGERLNSTPPPEAQEVIRMAARVQIAVQPTLRAVYGDLAIFDKSLISDLRFAEALPRGIISYLKSDAGRKAQQAQTDEYRQAVAHLFGSATLDPAKAMAVAPARALATLRMMVAAKVKLLFGTDTPSNEGIGNPPGLNGRLEISHWVDAGLSPAQILRAATLDNAVAFHLSDRGTIEKGKRADLLLLRENPLKTVAAYDTIEMILVSGQPIARSSLLATE